jgi:Spy/CpxP family protein refolding chaperone
MAGHGRHGGFQWWKNSDTVSKLNLSDTQVSQLDQTFNQHKANLKNEMSTMRQADMNLRTLLDQDNPDQAQVTAAANQVLAARANLERETTLMILDFRKILNAQQWKQLREMHPMGPGFGGMHMHGRHFERQGPPPAAPDGDQASPPAPQD